MQDIVPAACLRRSNLTPRLVLECWYVLLIGALATMGIAPADYSGRLLLVVAALLGFPCGLGGLVGLYVLTGLFNGLLGGASGFFFDACVVACYVIAAMVNVFALRDLTSARPGRAPGGDRHALVGLEFDVAIRQAHASGVRDVRLIEVRCGRQLNPVLMDFRPHRLNLWVEDGIVSQAKFDGEGGWQDAGRVAPIP